MRVSTQIVRHPFGVSAVAFASDWYGSDVWVKAKEQREVEHRSDVADAILNLPGQLLGVNSGYREHHGDFDGREAEWWSVIVYDGPPLP